MCCHVDGRVGITERYTGEIPVTQEPAKLRLKELDTAPYCGRDILCSPSHNLCLTVREGVSACDHAEGLLQLTPSLWNTMFSLRERKTKFSTADSAPRELTPTFAQAFKYKPVP